MYEKRKQAAYIKVQVSGFCKSIFAIHFGGELNEPVRVEMFSNVAGMVIVIADVIFFYALWNIFCKNKKEKCP